MRIELNVPFGVRFGLLGFKVAFGPAGFTVTWMLIPPWNPSMLVNWICEVPEDPGDMLKLMGLAVTLKSGTRTVTFSAWTSRPLVPFTVTMKTPVGDVLVVATRRLSFCDWPGDKLTDECSIDTVSPGEDTETANETVP